LRLGHTAQFLAGRGFSLDNYIAAVWLLERRAKGDHEPGERPNQFPKFSGRKPVSATGHTPWKLFEGWVAAKMPNGRTVGRWRVVFEDLERKFPDAGSVSEDDAQAWALELLHRLLPDAKSIGLLVNPTYASEAAAQTSELQQAVNRFGLRLLAIKASSPLEIEEAFVLATRERIEALQIGVDPLFGNHIEQIVALAARNRLPTIYPWREFTAAGGLMNYGSSIPEAFSLVGNYTA
jgi:hypothetical protein